MSRIGTEPALPALDERSLTGRIVVVTGGGRGLGEATCWMVAGSGGVAICADVRRELAGSVCDRLRGEGFKADPMSLDVSDPGSVEACIGEVIETYGRVDALINNAGTDVTRPFDELTLGDWDRILGVNLRGPILMSRAVFPVMRRQGYGHIVNIVSTAAKRTWSDASAYHASKWGALGFSHALHVEARPLGIKVTAIVAGGMRTPFLFERFPDLDPALLQEPSSVAETIRFVLTQPDETVIPEVMVIPMRETSWP